MGYYLRGDYYRGDYYQGDPGFFGSIGSFFKKIGGAALSFVPGVGPLLSSAVNAIGSGPDIKKRPLPPSVLAQGGNIMAGKPMLALPPAPMPGGAMTVAPTPRGALMAPGPTIRLSRTGKRIKINARTGKAVRHMRVTNPKALKRAIRRATGFAKLARKVLHFTSPKPPKGRAVFRRKRAKK